MVKTTVYLDPGLAVLLRHLARVQKRAQAELIREALTEYAQKAPRPKPQGIGKFRSGRSDVSERAEELLRQAVVEGRWP